MKTITLGELFTPAQLKQAAAIMVNCPTPHEDLVQVLKPDAARLDKLGVLVDYAAYLLEFHREMIMHAYLEAN